MAKQRCNVMQHLAEKHHKGHIYFCSVKSRNNTCLKYFTKVDKLVKHIKENHPNHAACRRCLKVISTKRPLIFMNHAYQCTGTNISYCKKCRVMYVDNKELTKHNEYMHKRPYTNSKMYKKSE